MEKRNDLPVCKICKAVPVERSGGYNRAIYHKMEDENCPIQFRAFHLEEWLKLMRDDSKLIVNAVYEMCENTEGAEFLKQSI